MSHRRPPRAPRAPLPPRAPTPKAPLEMRGLPSRLRECIDEQETNATALAELTGHSTPMITQIANGKKYEGVKAASLIRIANALGVRPAWLLLGEQPKHAGSAPAIISDAGAETLARAIVRELQGQPTRTKMSENELDRADNDENGE